MGQEEFNSRAAAYAEARPGYPAAAVDYIRSLAPPGAVFADVGAGTGKLTVQLAQYGNPVFAVEPNADMRTQLTLALASFANAAAVDGTAEHTTLPDASVDIITCAQALNWFDIPAFRAECRRIGKPGAQIIALFNHEQAQENGNARYQKSIAALYENPTIRSFPNPVSFTREKWLLYFLSMAGVPQEGEPEYATFARETSERFDRESKDGLLRLALVTKICH